MPGKDLVRRAAALVLTLSISISAAAQTFGPLGGQAAEGGVGGAVGGAVSPPVITSSPGNAGPTLQILTLPQSMVVAPVIVASKGNQGPATHELTQPAAGTEIIKIASAETKKGCANDCSKCPLAASCKSATFPSDPKGGRRLVVLQQQLAGATETTEKAIKKDDAGALAGTFDQQKLSAETPAQPEARPRERQRIDCEGACIGKCGNCDFATLRRARRREQREATLASAAGTTPAPVTASIDQAVEKATQAEIAPKGVMARVGAWLARILDEAYYGSSSSSYDRFGRRGVPYSRTYRAARFPSLRRR